MIRRLRYSLNLEHWQRMLFIMFFGQLVAAMGFSIIFPFLPLYVNYLGTRTQLSLEFWAGMVFSAQALAMAIASPIWGTLADRYGRKLMVERSMFIGSIVLLLMAFVHSAEQLVILRTVQGLFTGTISAVSALIAAETPREQSGYAMGVVQVGLWTGVAIGPLVGGIMADTWGFRIPFIVTAGLLFVAGILVWRGVKETYVPEAETSEERISLIAGWRRTMSLPNVGLTYVVRFLSGVGQMMIVPIAPLFVQALLPHNAAVGTTTGLIIGVASAASTATAIYLGRLGDRVGHRKILKMSLATAGLLYLPQALVTKAWQLLILQALTGAAVGGVIPSLSALLAQFTRPGDEGTTFGLNNSVVSASRAVAPMISASIAVWFGLRGAFVATALILLATAVLAALGLPSSKATQL